MRHNEAYVDTVNKNTYELTSPGKLLLLKVVIVNAEVYYQIFNGNSDTLIDSSRIGVVARDANLLTIPDTPEVTRSSHDETWEQPWGEQRFVHNHYEELAVIAESFTLRFRLFDEGLGFRYELRGQDKLVIQREETEFNIPPDADAWWIPALGQNHYEHLYKKTKASEIDTAHTPLTLELRSGAFMTIHEAALYDYGAMNIIPTEKGLMSSITPILSGDAGVITLPFTSPWRTVMFSDSAVGLGRSKIMLNLNEPSKIEDTSWIQPTKFMGIWWVMFIGYCTWASGEKHGATTRNAFYYINAAKKLGISALLIEGWNETWNGDWTKNGDKMNHMQPYPDFDIHAVTSYAKSQGIDIVGHHETSGNMSHYEWELPEAYDYYRTFGIRYVKTGYVSPRMDTGDFHSSQVGVRHYQKTIELAAERQMMLDIHEPVKGTGVERTWPNLMTREGVMGQEYEGGAVTPEHATVLPYTRLLAGPLDYTPGLFNLSGTLRKVSSTLTKQLAFYVTMYSPMQMVADLPEHYDGHPAFAFIRDVPVNWESTLPLDGVIGDYFVTARKNRDNDDWYVGGVTDEEERTVAISFNFLEDHRTYTATIYCDAKDTHWHDTPETYEIKEQAVTSTDTLDIRMAPGGGFAIRIRPADEIANPYPGID